MILMFAIGLGVGAMLPMVVMMFLDLMFRRW